MLAATPSLVARQSGVRRGAASPPPIVCLEIELRPTVLVFGQVDPDVGSQIEKILTDLDAKAAEPEAPRRPPYRAPPQRGCSLGRAKGEANPSRWT